MFGAAHLLAGAMIALLCAEGRRVTMAGKSCRSFLRAFLLASHGKSAVATTSAPRHPLVDVRPVLGDDGDSSRIARPPRCVKRQTAGSTAVWCIRNGSDVGAVLPAHLVGASDCSTSWRRMSGRSQPQRALVCAPQRLRFGDERVSWDARGRMAPNYARSSPRVAA